MAGTAGPPAGSNETERTSSETGTGVTGALPEPVCAAGAEPGASAACRGRTEISVWAPETWTARGSNALPATSVSEAETCSVPVEVPDSALTEPAHTSIMTCRPELAAPAVTGEPSTLRS